MELFNFHTHDKSEKNGIINLFPMEEPTIDKIYSIGLHPWYYTSNYGNDISVLKSKVGNSNIVAIGETGFDTNSPVDIEIQKKIFITHSEISELTKKPLIIHCVGFYNEVVELKKKIIPQQSWIIHGFTGKLGMAGELYRHGFYFSVSETILKIEKKADEFFKIISPDRIFFETDDKDFDIKNIYNFAAIKYDISYEELAGYINSNLKDIGI